MNFSKSLNCFVATLLLFTGIVPQVSAQETTLRGEQARTKIHQQVRALPEKATSLFYYMNEGIDFDLYLSFSCSKADCQVVSDALTKFYHLKSRAARLPEDLRRLDAPPDALLQPTDWQPSDAKAGVFAEGDNVLLFIDPEQGRIFLRRWST